MVVVKEIQVVLVDLVEEDQTVRMVDLELLDKVIVVVTLLVQLVEVEAAVRTALVSLLQLKTLVVMEATLYQILTVDPQLNMVEAVAVEVVTMLLEVLVLVAVVMAVRPQEQMPLLEQQTEVVVEVAEVATVLETVPIKMVLLVDLE